MMKTTPFEDLYAQLPPVVRKRAEIRYQELRREMLLRELRQSLKITQASLSARTGIKTSNLSRLERQSDMQIDTLRKIVTALGGRLEIVAKFKGADVRIKLPKVA
jgi:DNA-binding Xre family transcriptional regulator